MMAEEEQERMGSPYHEKCFPPYCDDASPQVDKTVISKMERDDLEDKYIVYADENLTLKKQIRNHERHIQRLQTALARQDNADKRGGVKVPASMRYDNNRVDSLESQNKHLQAKINVLKQQLMNHSFIHSKENRIAENKSRLQRREQMSPDMGYQNIGQTQSAREPKDRSFLKEESIYGKDSSISVLKKRIAVLEQLLESQKEKYRARIGKMEKELAAVKGSDKSLDAEMSEHSRKVSDNLEMIRLQRQSQEQAAKLSSLTDQYEAADRELAELRAALKQATENADELKNQLEREREKAREAQAHVTKSVSHTETIRALEEQIRDLQNEKATLKDTNEQLLLLTSGSQTKSEKSGGNESRLKKEISILELKLKEKIKEIEEKEEQLLKMESMMQLSGKKTPQSTPSQTKSESPSRIELIRENEKLRQQLDAVQPSEDEELKKKLRDALKENEELKEELRDLKNAKYRDEIDEEKEDLERKLKKAQEELRDLRRIAAEHEMCPKTYDPVPSDHDWKKLSPSSQKSVSRHEVEEVTVSEPAQKPVLVIVSQNEFEKVLLKKKKYKSKTEVVTPTSGKEMFDCKLEICVYDLEIHHEMVQNLRDIEDDPLVFVEWNFVGLAQRTVSMPVSQALFCTNVAYFGPLSDNVADYVKERELPVQLWLEKRNGDQVKVASGSLDLLPAMQSPSRAFIRSIHLQGQLGKASVHCAFKLHECCRSDSRSPVEDSLEVRIGRLLLKNSNFPAGSETTHLYVEYSLLGHGGPELETDSMPRAEVMQFNYNKKLMVNDENASHLGPLVKGENPKSLRFLILAEPCDLSRGTEVEEVGHADVNLVEEMLQKDQDLLSAHLPVMNNDREYLGNLSVTVIGVEAIKNYLAKS